MDKSSKDLLKGLLVVLTLGLSNQRLLDVNETNEIMFLGAITVLTLVLSGERFVGTFKDTNGVKYNINESFIDDRVFDENTLSSIQSTLSQLTKKETDALNLMAKGSMNNDIAKKLSVSESTVRNDLNSILRKLNINLTTNPMAKAVRRGL